MIDQDMASIDVDDISLTGGKCVAPINCDFNKDMCGWTHDLDTTNWYWDQGVGRLINATVLNKDIFYTPLDRIGRSDGMFMYTDFSTKDPTQNNTMKLQSEFVPATNGSCLTFYYIPLSFNDSTAEFQVV